MCVALVAIVYRALRAWVGDLNPCGGAIRIVLLVHAPTWSRSLFVIKCAVAPGTGYSMKFDRLLCVGPIKT